VDCLEMGKEVRKNPKKKIEQNKQQKKIMVKIKKLSLLSPPFYLN
jgi:hypothetical protein